MSRETESVVGIFSFGTPEAILVDFGLEKPVWIPRSVIIDYSPSSFEKGDEVELELPLWLVEEKDLI